MIGALLDLARVLLMTREQERRWLNDDRGDRRPIYAPKIVRHYQAWPGSGADRGRPYLPWPGSERR